LRLTNTSPGGILADVELLVVPWAPGPLVRLSAAAPAGGELRRPTGVPIDPSSDADVAALVDAYDAFWATAPLDETAIHTAHTALLEAAALLRGAGPAGPAEREYVRRHTRAIGGLTPADPVRYLTSL
jgi:hypothetical protein